MMKIEFDETKQLVIARWVGTAGKPEIVQLINSAVEESLKHNCFDLLFDMLEAKEMMSFWEGYDLHKNLTNDTDLTHGHRCAVVFSTEENRSKKTFYETVGVNWGQGIFRVFFDLKQGEQWLRPDPTKDSQ